MFKNNIRFLCRCFQSQTMPQVYTVLTKTICLPSNPFYIRYSSNQIDTYGLKKKISSQYSDYLRKVLIDFFEFSDDSCDLMLKSNHCISNLHGEHVKKNLEILKSYKFHKEVITKNLHLLEMDSDILKNKLTLISNMNFKSIDHGVPFLNLSTRRLITLYKQIKSEKDVVPHGNRLYLFSENMKIDPVKIAECISKRMFTYSMSFDHLNKTFHMLMDMGVKSENIMKDWWVLKYKSDVVKERILRFKHANRNTNLKIMPWMVRCPERILNRSIDLRKTSWEILGEKNSTMNYLAERLKCPPEVVNDMAKKIPAILTVRVSKARDILDYLFSEGFSSEDIIHVPRVLAHSLKTMQTRLEKLRKVGNNPKNLNILCKSKTDFKKHLESLQSSLIAITQ